MSKRVRGATSLVTELEIRAENLPAGVIGQVRGVAVVYGVVDSYGTRFKAGCLDRTKREKVAAGKVQLFVAEDEAWHQYGTRTHIGVVRSLETVGDREMMTADLFDTEGGRRAKEYLTAVTQAGAQTGLSIGFFDRDSCMVKNDGDSILEFEEVELEEISVTPRPAVPGAKVTGVRADEQNQEALWRAFEALCQTLPPKEVRARVGALLGNAEADDSHAAGRTPADSNADAEDSRSGEPETATMEERIAALRQSFAEV